MNRAFEFRRFTRKNIPNDFLPVPVTALETHQGDFYRWVNIGEEHHIDVRRSVWRCEMDSGNPHPVEIARMTISGTQGHKIIADKKAYSLVDVATGDIVFSADKLRKVWLRMFSIFAGGNPILVEMERRRLANALRLARQDSVLLHDNTFWYEILFMAGQFPVACHRFTEDHLNGGLVTLDANNHCVTELSEHSGLFAVSTHETGKEGWHKRFDEAIFDLVDRLRSIEEMPVSGHEAFSIKETAIEARQLARNCRNTSEFIASVRNNR